MENALFKSSGNHLFSVSKADLQVSGLLKSLVDEHADDDSNDVPMLQVDSATLGHALEYCKAYRTHGGDEGSWASRQSWTRKIVERAHVGKLILAARYLNIQPLLDFLCDHYLQQVQSENHRIELRSCSSSSRDCTAEKLAKAIAHTCGLGTLVQHCPRHARSDALINCTHAPFTGVIITFGAPEQCVPAFSLGLTGKESTEDSGWGLGLDFSVHGVWNNTEGDFKLEICEKGKKHALGHAVPGYRLELSVNEDDCFQCFLYRKSGNLGYRGGKVQQYPLHVELHTRTKSTDDGYHFDVKGLLKQKVVKTIEWLCAKTPAHTQMCCDMAARELEVEGMPASKRRKMERRANK